MSAAATDVLALCLAQQGKPYIFGYEVRLDDPNPTAFDCSELIEWACARLGLTPTMPDLTWGQEIHCRNNRTDVSIDVAIRTPGALLFRHRDTKGNAVAVTDWKASRLAASAHVVISLGDGRTMEAMGSAYGCKIGDTGGRGWTFAALIPGADYLAANHASQRLTVAVALPPPPPSDVDARVMATRYPGREIKRGTTRGTIDEWFVSCIQYQLNKAGYQVVVDGAFGPQTEGAVALWQANGPTNTGAPWEPIRRTGVVGLPSWLRLGLPG